jgi:hypothetical protein
MSDNDYYEELGRRLCAAVVSMRLGIKMDYALERYVKGCEGSEYWLGLARKISQDVSESIELDILQSGRYGPTPNV